MFHLHFMDGATTRIVLELTPGPSAWGDDTKDLDWRKVGSAIAMGAAIPVMHYTGMAAVTFAPVPMVHGDLSNAVSISSLGVIGIIGVTFVVLGLLC